jgi:hypothetical protein
MPSVGEAVVDHETRLQALEAAVKEILAKLGPVAQEAVAEVEKVAEEVVQEVESL